MSSVPIKLDAQHILPMPSHLKRLPATAYLGGLAKCVPIEKVCSLNYTILNILFSTTFSPMQRLNYGNAEYEVKNSDRFNDFVNMYTSQLFDEASEIYFIPLQKMDDDHIFGDIQIVKHAGHKVDLLRELVKRDGVRIDEHDIPFGKLII